MNDRFENFVVNSFEQLCINYANEKLQQFFNQHIFKLEQEEYAREKIEWSSISFVDNQECLDLIEKKSPVCVISILDEECRLGNATDTTLLDKLHSNLEKRNHYTKPKRSKTTFIINHYAGEVAYEITGFLDKNKDMLYDDIIEIGKESKIEFVNKLFKEDVVGGGVRKTVGTQFKDQVASLMTTLAATSPHYVRCIKPNPEKIPNNFNDDLILLQLRFSGMLDTIRIRKAGFPIRYEAGEFYQRYCI
jgi:myosin-7